MQNTNLYDHSGVLWNQPAWNARKKAFFTDEDCKTGVGDVAAADDDNNDDDDVDDTNEPQHEAMPSGLPPPVPGSLKSPTTRIPMKLAPLKRHRSESSSGFPRRGESSLDRLTRSWRSGDSDLDAYSSSTRSSLSSDRMNRDYTNLRFQDPEFYESPKVIETGMGMKITICFILNKEKR